MADDLRTFALPDTKPEETVTFEVVGRNADGRPVFTCEIPVPQSQAAGKFGDVIAALGRVPYIAIVKTPWSVRRPWWRFW
jgi:hypothetical protein